MQAEGKTTDEITREALTAYLALRRLDRLQEPTVTPHVIERDPDDDRVLECAVTAKAGLIVTGDSDLRPTARSTEASVTATSGPP